MSGVRSPKSRPWALGRGQMSRSLLGLSTVFVFLLSPVPAIADIFEWTDDQGNTHFSDNIGSVPEKYRKKARRLTTDAPKTEDLCSPQGARGFQRIYQDAEKVHPWLFQPRLARNEFAQVFQIARNRIFAIWRRIPAPRAGCCFSAAC